MANELPAVTAVAARYLSARAAAVYVQLLESGHIAVHADLDPADLDAINVLEEYGFLLRRNSERGYELLPTPAELLVPSLLYRVEWAYAPFGDLDHATRADLRAILEDSFADSEDVSAATPISSQALVGAAQIDAFLAQAIGEAVIVRALSAAEWSNNLPLVWSAIVDRMREGMTYQRVVSPFGLAAFGWDINHRDVTAVGVDLRVSLHPPTSPFYLFGDAEKGSTALVFVPPMNAHGEPRATYIPLADLAKQLLTTFEFVWKHAVPARYVLEHLRAGRAKYLGQAHALGGATAASTAASLFDLGIFADIRSDGDSVAALVEHGLVVSSRYTIGLTPLVPNLAATIVEIVRAYGAPE